MSTHSVNLSSLLVGEYHGAVAQHVYHALAVQGRSSIATLSHQTGLPIHQIRNCLTVLIQHHLVHWYLDGRHAIYGPNFTVTQHLLRYGKYTQVVEDRYGAHAAEIISYLLQSGHASVGDVLEALSCGGRNKLGQNGVALSNGVSSPDLSQHIQLSKSGHQSSNQQDRDFDKLLRAGLVCPTHESHFRSEADNRTEAERMCSKIEVSKMFSKAESNQQFERAVQEIMGAWRLGRDVKAAPSTMVLNGKRRRAYEIKDDLQNKRIRLNDDSSHISNPEIPSSNRATSVDSESFKPGTAFAVQHEKFNVFLRNACLADAVERRISKATATVYRTVLGKLEPNLHDCKFQGTGEFDSDEGSCFVTTQEVVDSISESADLSSTMAVTDEDDIDEKIFEPPKKRQKRSANGGHPTHATDDISEGFSSDSEDFPILAGGRNVRNGNGILKSTSAPGHRGRRSAENAPHYSAVRSHLMLLMQHPMAFLERRVDFLTRAECWSVDFRSLVYGLQHESIIEAIRDKYGSFSARLASILAEHGKIDDKALSALSLIKEKEMRPLLTEMQRAGLLELQEVPRDNARLASRTSFLFFFDHDRCLRRLTEECLKTMARLLERAAVEKEPLQATLDKARRSDVVGREEQLLSATERQALGQWQAIEEKLWNQVGRIDDLLALFQDF